MHKNAYRVGDGDYCVYVWRDADKKPFYVGCGKHYRFHDVNEKSRSREFMSIYNNGGCYPEIVRYGMCDKEAREYEKGLILAYAAGGANLVNKQYLVDYYHTPAKLSFYRKRRKTTV